MLVIISIGVLLQLGVSAPGVRLRRLQGLLQGRLLGITRVSGRAGRSSVLCWMSCLEISTLFSAGRGSLLGTLVPSARPPKYGFKRPIAIPRRLGSARA